MRYVVFSKGTDETPGVIGSTCYGWKDGPEGVIEAINEGMLKPLGMEIVAEATLDSDTHLLLLKSSELSPDAIREATDKDWETRFLGGTTDKDWETRFLGGTFDHKTDEERVAEEFVRTTELMITNYISPPPPIAAAEAGAVKKLISPFP
jgi:hypothetical protein